MLYLLQRMHMTVQLFRRAKDWDALQSITINYSSKNDLDVRRLVEKLGIPGCLQVRRN